MGLFRTLRETFQRGLERADYLFSLDQSIECLVRGICDRLYKQYRNTQGEVGAKLLSAAVLSEAVVRSPASTEAREYLDRNRRLISAESKKLSSDPELSKALSYLYAAEIIQIAAQSRRVDSPRSDQLVSRAADLGIYIPNTYDICGSSSHDEAVAKISEFAHSLVKAN